MTIKIDEQGNKTSDCITDLPIDMLMKQYAVPYDGYSTVFWEQNGHYIRMDTYNPEFKIKEMSDIPDVSPALLKLMEQYIGNVVASKPKGLFEARFEESITLPDGKLHTRAFTISIGDSEEDITDPTIFSPKNYPTRSQLN